MYPKYVFLRRKMINCTRFFFSICSLSRLRIFKAKYRRKKSTKNFVDQEYIHWTGALPKYTVYILGRQNLCSIFFAYILLLKMRRRDKLQIKKKTCAINHLSSQKYFFRIHFIVCAMVYKPPSLNAKIENVIEQ